MESIQDYEWLKDLQEIPLCHNCLAENHPYFHFCHKCNTPLTAIASMDPVFSIWSRGNTWHKAASRPYRPIILIGMWLLFGPRLVMLFYVIYSSGLLTYAVWPEALLTLGLFIAYAVLLAAILFKTTRNYYRLKAQRAAEPPDANDSDFV